MMPRARNTAKREPEPWSLPTQKKPSLNAKIQRTEGIVGGCGGGWGEQIDGLQAPESNGPPWEATLIVVGQALVRTWKETEEVKRTSEGERGGGGGQGILQRRAATAGEESGRNLAGGERGAGFARPGFRYREEAWWMVIGIGCICVWRVRVRVRVGMGDGKGCQGGEKVEQDEGEDEAAREEEEACVLSS
jgi:hypothetical protein